VNDRSHLSIGEVLSLLQEDFPDITISKIRFLESQGLLDPERTPSGYRKFYDSDIVRLRWILRQQRENFLPLKVIKDRLAAGDVDFDEVVSAEAGREPDVAAIGAAAEPTIDATGAAAAVSAPPAPAPPTPAPPTPAPAAPAPEVAAQTAPAARVDVAGLLQEPPAPRAGSRTAQPAPVPEAAAPPEPATGAGPVGLSAGGQARSSAPLFDTGATAVSLTLDELMNATGLTAREIGDLERFGMLTSRSLGSTTYYDEDAFLVARYAAAFRSHGVEARHLRMYKVAAEREVGVFEQLLLPLSRKRGPQARKESTELVNELAELGDGLRSAMLRMLLRDYLDGV
jgi:DNA-binding transcriptional MerR regulator